MLVFCILVSTNGIDILKRQKVMRLYVFKTLKCIISYFPM
jgi:hypothetical protein